MKRLRFPLAVAAISLAVIAILIGAGGLLIGNGKIADAEQRTGYVRDGISPLGQRQQLQVVLDQSAQELPTMYVSAGKRGLQLELAPADLIRLTGATVAPPAS
jgi:Cys-tRNA(Pro)/Cys-tRNA(Cys) deacylase